MKRCHNWITCFFFSSSSSLYAHHTWDKAQVAQKNENEYNDDNDNDDVGGAIQRKKITIQHIFPRWSEKKNTKFACMHTNNNIEILHTIAKHSAKQRRLYKMPTRRERQKKETFAKVCIAKFSNDFIK